MKHFDISKILFYGMSIILVLGLTFTLGLHSGHYETAAFRAIRTTFRLIKEVISEAPTLLKTHPENFLNPAFYEGAGVTINDQAGDQTDLILISGFFEKNNQIRIMKRDGTVIARWPLRFSKIFPDASHVLPKIPDTDWNIDTHGALALPDGSVIFNFEYGGLVKLDRCNRVVWTLPRMAHHSVERSEKGGFWVPGQRYHPVNGESPFPPFELPINEDTIMRVSENGELLEEISVPELFYRNDLEALLTVSETNFEDWNEEIVHLNKISELPLALSNDFPMFEAGDLLLSMRGHNLIMVINPNTGKVKWWKVGPWLRQHDPEFKPGGTITVFNNNIYYNDFKLDQDDNKIFPRISNIIEINPVSGDYKIVYGDIIGQEMLTAIRGKHELTSNGGLLITEFRGGRAFETDASGRIIWEYINRYDSDEAAEITEARVYPATYFDVKNWSCNEIN